MATQSLDVLGLTPNQDYTIKVFATYKDGSGTTHVSDYSLPLAISTPSLDGSGSNFQTTNYGTDIELAGGSLFAGKFPPNLGQLDLTLDTIATMTGVVGETSSGVIVNQTGIAAYASGVQEFFLNAKTGNAYFAGTIQATIIESTGYSGVTNGSAYSTSGMAINLNNGSITSKQFRIDTSGNAYFNGDVSGSVYSGTGLGTYIGNTAQASANGKNVIHYGAITGTGTTSGFGPNGTLYYTSGGTPLFPSTISSGYSNQQVGDTFFSYNSSGNIISQYTATSGTSWSKTQISSQVISELDVGKLTAGIIGATISMTSATIIGGTITGGVIQTSDIGNRRVSLGGSSDAIEFINSSNSILGSFTTLDYSTLHGIIISASSTPDTTFLGSSPAIAVHTNAIDLYGNPGATISSPFLSVNASAKVTVGLGSSYSDSTLMGSHSVRNMSHTSSTSTPIGGSPGDVHLIWA